MTSVKEVRSVVKPLRQPHNAFLLLGTFFGFTMLFLTPPALVGDEPNHFFRAYQISEGTILGVRHEGNNGWWLPESVLQTNRLLVGHIEMNHQIKFDTALIWELRQLPLNPEQKVFVPFHNTVIYSPVPYIPQVTGIMIGKVFGASALTLIYAARIVNLIFFLALAYLSIRITPVHKWTFAFLWLTPTTMFQAASASADAFTFGICFLAIGSFLYYGFDTDARSGKLQIAALFVICLLAVLSKQAYVLLPFLFLIIPASKFRSKWHYHGVFAALITICFAAVGAWSAIVKPLFLPYRVDVFIDPDQQLDFILSDPLNFLYVAVKSYIKLSKYYFITFFGGLTWLDLFVPQWLTVYLFIIVLTIALLDKNTSIRISNLNKALFFLIVTGTAVLVTALLYMTWSPVGADRVAGIQGRYFIPVAPLFFLLFYNRKLNWNFFRNYVSLFVYFAAAFSLCVTLYTIFRRYYW